MRLLFKSVVIARGAVTTEGTLPVINGGKVHNRVFSNYRVEGESMDTFAC